MSDQIIPGSYPTGSCPKPTEIVCIETEKVYDFCFQVERKENVCFSLPEYCHPNSDDHVWCMIKKVECEEISREPLSTPGGFFNVTFLITVGVKFRICKRYDLDDADEKDDWDQHAESEHVDSKHKCRFWRTFSFTKTVTLCAPEGTVSQCEIPTYSCGPCVLTPTRQVCCTFILCILIQTKALVKLLLPSYGFCVPAECVQVSPEFPECPPENLFPPQCLLVGGSAKEK